MCPYAELTRRVHMATTENPPYEPRPAPASGAATALSVQRRQSPRASPVGGDFRWWAIIQFVDPRDLYTKFHWMTPSRCVVWPTAAAEVWWAHQPTVWDWFVSVGTGRDR